MAELTINVDTDEIEESIQEAVNDAAERAIDNIEIDTDDIEYKVKEAAEEAIRNLDLDELDLSDAVKEAVGDADFSSKVEEAVEDADFDDAVEDAVAKLDLSGAVLRALKDATVRAELQDFMALSVKRAMAINFGMVTEDTHLDEMDQAKARNADLKERIADLEANLKAINDEHAEEPDYHEERVAAEYAEMYPDEPDKLDAFADSPLGKGIGPKPYVKLDDPEGYVDAEDDEATERYLARTGDGTGE